MAPSRDQVAPPAGSDEASVHPLRSSESRRALVKLHQISGRFTQVKAEALCDQMCNSLPFK
jgi:hypothetical protein